MGWSPPRWIAHRGGGSLAPENTLAGIRLAARLGFRAVEFDVMLSGDGTPLLIHDETLERTTNGCGRVSETQDAVLFALDAGGGEPLPTLHQACTLCARLGLWANVEIKPAAGQEERTAERVVRQLADCWRGPVPPLLSSFSPAALAVARDLAPALPRGLLYEVVPGDWLDDRQRLQAVSLHCAAEYLSDAVLVEAQARRIPLLCYTVNRPEQAASLLARGVSSLFTDQLDLFGAETAAYKALHFGS